MSFDNSDFHPIQDNAPFNPHDFQPIQEAPGPLKAAALGAASAVPGNNTLAGLLMAGAKAFQNRAANSDVVGATKAGYRQEEKNYEDMKDQAWEAHPVAYGAGKTGGVVAEGVLAPEAAFGGLGLAAQGAIAGADENQRDLVASAEHGDIIPAVTKDVLLPAATGYGIGKAAQYVGGKISEFLPTMKNQATAEAFNMTPSEVKNASPVGDLSHIDDWAQEKQLINYASTPLDKLKAVSQIHADAGNNIGQFIRGVSQNGDDTTLREGVNALYDSFQNKIGELQDAQGGSIYLGGPIKDIHDTLDGTLRQLQKLDQNGQLNFETLSKLKSNFGDMAFSGRDIDRPALETYKLLDNGIDGLLDKYSKTSTLPQDAVKAFENSKKDYSMSSDLLPGLTRANAKGIAGGTGLSDTMAELGTAGLVAGGHPIGAAAMGLGYIAKKAVNMAAPDLGPNSAYKILNAVQSNAPGFGRFAKPLINAAKEGGTQAVAAMNYILHTQYPEYQEAYNNAMSGNDDKNPLTGK